MHNSGILDHNYVTKSGGLGHQKLDLVLAVDAAYLGRSDSLMKCLMECIEHAQLEHQGDRSTLDGLPTETLTPAPTGQMATP